MIAKTVNQILSSLICKPTFCHAFMWMSLWNMQLIQQPPTHVQNQKEMASLLTNIPQYNTKLAPQEEVEQEKTKRSSIFKSRTNSQLESCPGREETTAAPMEMTGIWALPGEETPSTATEPQCSIIEADGTPATPPAKHHISAGTSNGRSWCCTDGQKIYCNSTDSAIGVNPISCLLCVLLDCTGVSEHFDGIWAEQRLKSAAERGSMKGTECEIPNEEAGAIRKM